MTIKLTKKQEKGRELAIEWFKSPSAIKNKPFFAIDGRAGCGKSTLIDFLIEGLGLGDNNVAYVTFTGVAAQVLISKGIINAQTIHRTIYTPVPIGKGKVRFELKDRDAMDGIRLIVVDEGGMVNKELQEDLMSFDIPIIVLGDTEQLLSFSGERGNFLAKPDIVLDEPMRQSLDSPILRLAYKILDGGGITYQDEAEGTIKIVNNMEQLDYMLSADQIITSSNASIQDITKLIRGNFGLDSPYPYKGEKLMCLENNWNSSAKISGRTQFLVNGLLVRCTKFHDYDKFTETFNMDIEPLLNNPDENSFKRVISDGLYFEYNLIKSDPLYDNDFVEANNLEKTLTMRDVYVETNDTKINKFTYGYAMTEYKAQGSEFNRGHYNRRTFGNKDHQRRQMYVAVTRFKDFLSISL